MNTEFELDDFKTFTQMEGISLPESAELDKQLRLLEAQERYRERRQSEARKERQWFWGKIFAFLTATAAAGGVTYTQVVPKSIPAIDAKDVQGSVKEEGKATKARLDVAEKQIRGLGVIAVEQQEQLVDSVKYIGDKIDAAHPRQQEDLQAVKKPQSLLDAERAMGDRKKKAKAGQLLEGL